MWCHGTPRTGRSLDFQAFYLSFCQSGLSLNLSGLKCFHIRSSLYLSKSDTLLHFSAVSVPSHTTLMRVGWIVCDDADNASLFRNQQKNVATQCKVTAFRSPTGWMRLGTYFLKMLFDWSELTLTENYNKAPGSKKERRKTNVISWRRDNCAGRL